MTKFKLAAIKERQVRLGIQVVKHSVKKVNGKKKVSVKLAKLSPFVHVDHCSIRVHRVQKNDHVDTAGNLRTGAKDMKRSQAYPTRFAKQVIKEHMKHKECRVLSHTYALQKTTAHPNPRIFRP